MNKVLVVGGTFDHDGGRPSGLVKKISEQIQSRNDFSTTIINGGTIEYLHSEVFNMVVDYDIVLWFANVSNDAFKLRDVKSLNPKCILITSKRNDDNKYTFAELISRALAIKANLTVEFSKVEDKFNMTIFDPLGNVFYSGMDIDDMTNSMMNRALKLTTFTRVPSVKVEAEDSEIPGVPEETKFFNFAHNCADIFHNLIRPARGTERFLGNMSFRCQNGFPSFKGENGLIYVSKRNVDKSDINAASFVPTYLDDTNTVRYYGDNKPSVDTPVQLRLYRLFPWANYMIHAHCYVDTSRILHALPAKTANPVPCGALEEVDEIVNAYVKSSAILWEPWHKEPPRLLAVNLIGHGCILIARDVEIFSELQKHKNNCFIARPAPEFFDAEGIISVDLALD